MVIISQYQYELVSVNKEQIVSPIRSFAERSSRRYHRKRHPAAAVSALTETDADVPPPVCVFRSEYSRYSACSKW